MMNNTQENKFKAIEETNIIVGIDIAKNTHWAVIISPNGRILMKSFSFNNTLKGFKCLVENVEKVLMMINGRKAIIGMEPTGHYWKALAKYLKKEKNIKVVTVNPYHVKKSKELDDNSQTKNDKKDCLTIARIVRDARYFEPYIPEGIWEELRIATTIREELVKRENAIKNKIIRIQDEYFPEYTKIFKKILSRMSEIILKVCPFVPDVLEKGYEGIYEEIRRNIERGYRIQKIKDLCEAAKNSIGTKENIEAVREQMKIYMEEVEMIQKQKIRIEKRLEELLKETGYYNNMISKNEEIKKLYKYLTTRKENPLKKKQAIIAVEGKIIQIIFALTSKNLEYNATRVFNQKRIEQLQAA